MSLPGGEPPPAGLLGEAEPAVYAGRMTSGGGVAVNTRGVAVMEAEQQAAVSLITEGVPAALLAKGPGLWGAAAAVEADNGRRIYSHAFADLGLTLPRRKERHDHTGR